MDNKLILAQAFQTNYDTAVNFVRQNNLYEAKTFFQKALEKALKLVEITYGPEQTGFISKAKKVGEHLKLINQKIEEAEADAKKKPVAGGPATPAKSAKKEEGGEEEARPRPTVEEALAKLNELTGLSEVKAEVNSLVAELQVQMMRRQRGMNDAGTSHHLVFKGNPGTGKTTVARIMADIYYALGVLEKGHLVEVQRNDLVAGYVGQTAIKTQEVIDKAMGGVLFVDEAYTLAKEGGSDFGQEAIDTLLKGMEDHRDDLIVIIAGYDEPIQRFINSNAGLQSRFPTSIQFTDYNGEEMFTIFSGMCKKGQYTMSPEVQNILRNHFNQLYANRGENFGNARDVRNFFEKIKRRQSMRISRLGASISDATLAEILPEDLGI